MVEYSRPFTGAWIETFFGIHIQFCPGKVAPSPGRGLKRAYDEPTEAAQAVAPSPGRGLKHIEPPEVSVNYSRPFTGAWIETFWSVTA